MANDTPTESAPTWGTLQVFARDQVQQFIQRILEEEVTELLGRARSERRDAVGASAEYRNGHGKPRHLSMQGGTITLRRPRVRGLEGRFESKILPLFQRRTMEVGQLLPELYLHGRSLGDFELALRGVLGEGAPLSASSIARLRTVWESEFSEWRRRRLDDRELVYAWADGVYVKAGLEKGQGLSPRRRRGDARRPQGAARARPRAPRVDRELVGGAARAARPRPHSAQAPGRRRRARPLGHSGTSGQRSGPRGVGTARR